MDGSLEINVALCHFFLFCFFFFLPPEANRTRNVLPLPPAVFDQTQNTRRIKMNLLDTDERHLASSSLKPANRWTFIAGFALISQADARRVWSNESYYCSSRYSKWGFSTSGSSSCSDGIEQRGCLWWWWGVGYNFEEDFGPCAAWKGLTLKANRQSGSRAGGTGKPGEHSDCVTSTLGLTLLTWFPVSDGRCALRSGSRSRLLTASERL